MQAFLERMAECLEVPSVTADYRFRETPGWSSLMGFAILVTIENDYGVQIAADDFIRLETIGDLAKKAGV